MELKNNTVFNNHQWGIYLHAVSNDQIVGNTSFNNGSCQFIMYHNGGQCRFRNNIVKQNVFVSKFPSQLVGQYESDTNDLNQYGVIDSNYYARPFDETATIRGIINWGQGGNYSLTDWRTFSGGLDLHSKSSPLTYSLFRNEGAGGTNRFSSNFDASTDGWIVLYSRYNNAEAVRDLGQLDGGSLRISHPTPSGQSNSYAQIVKPIGRITKGKPYVLRFDAVATAPKNVLIYLRQYGPPFREFDQRYTIVAGPTRQSYELPFVASDNDTTAVVMFQTDEDGTTYWIDNVRFQEDASIQNHPDDYIKLYYNPTSKDSLITLNGIYRDVKNNAYANQMVLKAFTSVILLKDALPAAAADLSLSLQTDRRVLSVGEPITYQLRVSNQGGTPAGLARWTLRLPANIQFINTNGTPSSDNVLVGTVAGLAPHADTIVTFMAQPTAPGWYRTAAQLTTATSPDPDSTPDSGTADGEDDAVLVEFRVGDVGSNVFTSPNPKQRTLWPVIGNQPAVSSTKADLSVQMTFSNRVPALNELITCTLLVRNAGGADADDVQVENRLPDGLRFVGGTGWTADSSSNLLHASVGSVASGAVVSLPFQVRAVSVGHWIAQAQISAASPADSDSTPENGFTNGEDDTVSTDVNVWTK